MKKLFILVSLIILLSGCSVGMALSGNEDQVNPDSLSEGATRNVVNLRLGKPVKESKQDNGETLATYQFVKGNAPSVGRAVTHGTLSLFTLGLWEVVGTPVEAVAAGEDIYRIEILFGPDNRVKRINEPYKYK